MPSPCSHFWEKVPNLREQNCEELRQKDQERESYGDSAIGYVQVKSENNLCTEKAIVTPEHKISKKRYGVTVICNEEVVLSALCDSCAASLGGCKHAIAFLSWLHRRSEEPSVTEVTCYWKKSKLSTVVKSIKFVKGKDLGKWQVIN
ncbi:hypothetical protein AVEN_143708-1 [Araneus ventricosus]|uniref:SWIM-type domain-containing protein n=1 Tax=Araneus ventricosus TaxID=182803 RepID=A0A4Y2AQX6_ARAVE|nr:hypothetical protein AVEN_143708-1 [Araneus ventricosus]